jgi:hypothetical protein
MIDHELKNIDPDDIADLLGKVEKSFNIRFGHTELMHISSFGELCDHIAGKIQLQHSSYCTSQQAFYQLREAIASTLPIDKKSISTDSSLADLFPAKSRRSKIRKLEGYLGFKLTILRPPSWVTGMLSIILLSSFITLFFVWQIGLPGLLLSIAGLWLANKTGNELVLQTVGQMSEKLTRENYLRSRRNPKSFNKNEIENILTDWFSKELNLEKSKLTKEAKFV